MMKMTELKTGSQTWKIVLIAVLGIIAVALPFITPSYLLRIVDMFLIGSIFALSLNVLLGYTGLLPFGHAIYFGVGAYGVALLMDKAGLPYFAALPASLIITTAVAVIVGYFCSRVVAMGFAILTMALGQLFYTIFVKWYHFTGGDDGISGIHPPDFIASGVNYYFFVLVVFLIAVWALWRIVNSPFGYTLRYLRDNRPRAQAIGINIQHYQWLSYIVAGVFAGLAGCIFCTLDGIIDPQSLAVGKSSEAIIMVIVGGTGVFGGPIVGALLITILQFYVIKYTLFWPFVMGTILLLVVRFLPGGITGYIMTKWRTRGLKQGEEVKAE